MSKRRYPTTTPDWKVAVRRRTSFYILVSVLLAVLFGILVYQFFSNQQRFAPGELTWAVFAACEINNGTILTADLMEVREVSRNALPESYLHIKEQAIGKKTLHSLVKGEIILPEKLVGEFGGIVAQRCPSGKWCVSIPVEWFISPPPAVAEGDRLEIASVLPGNSLEDAGFIATDVQVVSLPEHEMIPAYVLALYDWQALSLLYTRANAYQLLVLLRPSGE
ncbi:MAG: SAF domain-containing protein [Anaerolineales bacterium]